MNKSERILAFLSYLLSVIVALPVLLFGRGRGFARFHALQSAGIFAVGVGGFLVWLIIGWIVSLVIPIVGAPVAAALFALVITLLLVLIVLSIRGMTHALRDERKPVPLFGIPTIRAYIRLSGQPAAGDAPQEKKPAEEAPDGPGAQDAGTAGSGPGEGATRQGAGQE